MSSRPRIVVLGMLSKLPVGGVVWQNVHYLVGLERLGYDVYYVEAHARTPSMFVGEGDRGSRRAAEFIDRVMRRFGFGTRWAFHALHDDGACYGLSERELRRLYASAALVLNLHGGTMPLPEHAATDRLVFLETDPVELQVHLHNGNAAAVEYLDPHRAFFTFGENLGSPDCRLPLPEQFRFLPTRQPVVLDFWAGRELGPGELYTTVGNWRQRWRSIEFDGEVYAWSKDHEFVKFLDLPARAGRRFELAISQFEEDDRRLLEANGWRVRPAHEISEDADVYRDYVAGSRGEFTVAKDQNVRLRTGWFSDRSATYLAAGRPVVTQDTGFGNILPTGEGLFGFSNMGEAAAAIETINGNYERNRRAAAAVAREYFSHDVVLGGLLEEVGCRAKASVA